MKYIKEKIKGSKLNLKNWGVSDYTDKGDFDSAYSSARKAGEKEFMWNNKRFHTNKDTDPIIKNPKNEREVALNNHYKEYYPEFVKNYNSNRPNVNIDPEIYRASYTPKNKTLNIRSYDDEIGDFIAELAHHKQKNGIKEDIKYIYESLRYGDRRMYDKEGTIEYDTHRLIEPALYMQRDGNLSKEDILKLQKYLKVKENGLLGKDTYKAIVDKYYNKDTIKEYLSNVLPDNTSEEFKNKRINQKYPDSYDNVMIGYYLYQIGKDHNINLKGLTHNKEYYYGEDDNWEGAYFDDNQLLKLDPNKKNFDTLALQRELSNRGYKLPKSTKSDGTFDGIWGDETKNALLDYQINNYAEGGKLNNHTNINMKFKEETKKLKKGEKKASRKERKYQKRSDAFNSALQNIENLRASGASASEIGVAQGNLGRLQNRLGADGLNRLREEQRTQAIARDVTNTQARETVQANTGSFGSYQSPQISVAMPTRTAQIAPVPQITPQITPQTNLANQFKTRGEAFNYARKQGWKTFTYDDGKGKYKQFTTEVAVPDSGTAKQQGQQGQQSQNPQTETQEQGQSTNKNKQFIYLGNRGEPLLNRKFTYSIPNFPILTNDLNLYRSFEGYIPGPNAETDISNQKIENKIPNLKVDSIKDVPSIPIVNSGNFAASTSEPKQYLTIGNHPSFFNKKLITSNRFLNQGLVSPSIFFKQGGTIEKLQTGGWLSKILSRLFTTAPNPNEHRVNENTTTVYEEGTPFIGRPFEKRGITSNGQTSSMYIKNPNTSKADTTFYSPGYSKDPELYPEFTPQDIRSGNKKGRGKESFMRKFQSPEYFPHLKYQQGGVIGSNEEEVVIDFVSRFSQMTGIDPNTDQGQQVLSPVVNLFVEGGYIQQYGSMDDNGRDQMVQDIVYQMQEGQNQTVEYAKKGAKLKLLRQYK